MQILMKKVVIRIFIIASCWNISKTISLFSIIIESTLFLFGPLQALVIRLSYLEGERIVHDWNQF